MAKKKKEPVVIDQTELKSTTIGVLETKESGPWAAIIIIGLLLIGIFFLDDIREFINNGGLSNIPIANPQTPTSSEQEEEPKEEEPREMQYYELVNSPVVKMEDYELGGVTIANHTLTFQIENKGGVGNYLMNHDYYIELYDTEKTLLERFKIENINISTSHTFTYETKTTNATYFTLHLMTESDYPAIVLKKEDGVTYLKCDKNNETITYYFDNKNELTNLEYMLRVPETENDYETLFDHYLNLTDTYNRINGVESDAYPSATGFEYYVNINLNTIPNITYQSQFTERKYYDNHTSARLISFELESSGYTCE